MSHPIRYYPNGNPPQASDLFIVERANQNNYTFTYAQLAAAVGLPVLTTALLLFGNGTNIPTQDTNLSWNATTGLLSNKNISSPGPGSHDETYGALSKIWAGGGQNTAIGYNARCGTNISADLSATQNTVIGADSFTGNFTSYGTVVGAASSNTGGNAVVIGAQLTNTQQSAILIGAGSSVTAAAIGAFGQNVGQSHIGGIVIGAAIASVKAYEFKYGWAFGLTNDSSFRMVGSTGAFVERDNFHIDNTWIDSTDATRKVRTIFYGNDTAEREFMRADANGTGIDVFFNGASVNIAGAVKFGTYTAGALAVTGSIAITDAGGTVRRLLVG